MRKRTRRAACLILPALVVSFTACGSKPEMTARAARVANRPVTLYAPADEPESLGAAAEALAAFNSRIFPLIDIYSPDSEISRANQIAIRSRFPVSRDTQRILEYAQRLSLETDGVFDISDATLRHVWHRHFQTEPDDLPAAPLIHATRAGIGSHHVDVRGQSLLLLAPETQLDLNDFVRPYLIDLTIIHIRNQGVHNIHIQAEDYGRVLGSVSATRSWSRAIPHPRDPDRIVGDLVLPDGSAFAMAGLAHHFAVIGEKRIPRIIDPRSGWPPEAEYFVIVLGPVTADCYALAHSLFILGREKGLALLTRKPRFQALFIRLAEPLEVWITPQAAPLFTPREEYRDAVHILEPAD